MSAVPKSKITPEEYLAFERKASSKHEYYLGEIFAMAGAGFLHNIIKGNLEFELRLRLGDGPGRVLSSDQKTTASKKSFYFYPDLLIYCGKPVFEENNQDILLNPQVIFEILSESTEAFDRGKKYHSYQKIESLQEYVLISQNAMEIERLHRTDINTWTQTFYRGTDVDFSLATLPIQIPMEAVYKDVVLVDESE